MTICRVALCTIIKEEHPYLEEWLDYNLKLGFDHIYLYDNDDKNPHVLHEKYKENVTLIPYYGRMLQLVSYYQFLLDYGRDYEWVAYLDADEFIVLRKHKSIQELLIECGMDCVLALNWVFFGSSGLETHDQRPVLERFQMRQEGVNEHVKIIARTSAIECMITPHHGRLRNGNTRDCKGNLVTGPFNKIGDEDIACVYHYFTKSKEEFIRKCARGKADMMEYRTFEGDFWRHDFNEKKDTSALDFYRSSIE